MSLSLEYIAGYVDADGTIVIVKAKRPQGGFAYYGKLCVYSQNLGVLKNTQQVIGGKISMSGNVFNLQLSPKETVKAIQRLEPLLQVKAEQARLVLELHRMIAASNRGKGHADKVGRFLPESIWEERAELYNKIKQLNKADAHAFRTNRMNSVDTQEWAIPSQAAEGKGSAEGVTTSCPSPNSNGSHEFPARKGRDSLSSTVLQ